MVNRQEDKTRITFRGAHHLTASTTGLGTHSPRACREIAPYLCPSKETRYAHAKPTTYRVCLGIIGDIHHPRVQEILAWPGCSAASRGSGTVITSRTRTASQPQEISFVVSTMPRTLRCQSCKPHRCCCVQRWGWTSSLSAHQSRRRDVFATDVFS